ncbi:MAG: hypothetical protein Q9160_007533 [Pyrenula sp. 1 TL-2023]
MARFLELSDEVVLQIVSYFSNIYSDKPHLCRLALVARRLQPVATNRLFQDIDLDGTTEKYSLFLRSIVANTKLATHVRSLRLHWNNYLSEGNPQELLSRLTNLRHLFMKITQSYNYDPKPYLPPPSQVTNFYYEMKLYLESPSPNDLPNVLLLNRIHVLEITLPTARPTPQIAPAKRTQAQTAPLNSLTLASYSKVSPVNLENLLSYPRALKHLSLPVPILPLPGLAGQSLWAGVDGPLSPAAVNRALSPTAHSIQSLEIHGKLQYWPDGHDGSQLSLRDFSALKTATIPAYLLFSTFSHSELRIGLHRLLPASIEDITIHFRTSSSPDPFSFSRISTSPLPWLLGLAHHRPSSIPRLRRIGLCEYEIKPGGMMGCGTNGGTASSLVEWDVPEEVKTAFAGDGDGEGEEEAVEVWGHVLP